MTTGWSADLEGQVRTDLARIYRLIDHLGFGEGVDTHHSAALSADGRYFLLHQPGAHFSEVTAESLVVHDALALDPTDAHAIHGQLHLARPDARFILHSHTTNATGLAAAGARLVTSTQQAALFHGRVAYTTTYLDAGTRLDDAVEMARTIGDRDVLVLKHHGVVTVGPDAAAALFRLFFFERACELQAAACRFGTPVAMDDQLALDYAARAYTEAPALWNALLRIHGLVDPVAVNPGAGADA